MVGNSWTRYTMPYHFYVLLTKAESDEIASSPNILITEVLHHSDKRIRSDEVEEARRKEIENHVRRGTWGMIFEEDVPEDAKVISGSLVITIKGVDTENPTFKTRFVAHGN